MRNLRKHCLLFTLIFIFLYYCWGEKKDKEKEFFGVELYGKVFGYKVIATSSFIKDNKIMTLVESKYDKKATILGMSYDSTVFETFHIDPETGNFTFYESDVEFGTGKTGTKVVIKGDIAYITSKSGAKPKEVPLAADVVCGDPISIPRIAKEIIKSEKKKVSYKVLDVSSGDVQEVTYKKVGSERLKLGEEEYDTVIIHALNYKTGQSSKSWLSQEVAKILKTVLTNDIIVYRTDSSVVNKLEKANFDDIFFAKTDVYIADIRSISYLKVKAVLRPIGEWITKESLTVPGQRFSGTVKDNLIEGVFEVNHKRYDGRNAPTFPGDFSKDESLSKYLEAEDYIESDDPVLIKKAKEITAGAKDSWEAARRLCRWVAENIEYKLPGGVSARHTYDIREGACGAHSQLLTAFCRAVGIPCRFIMGCMFSGKLFAEHAWNEVYMGKAGWIPIDSTAFEFDYIDSGHIRLGYKSRPFPKKAKILDYKIEQPEFDKSGESIPAKYQPFTGEYGNQNTFKVFFKNGKLVLYLPTKQVIELNEPDKKGLWYFMVSKKHNVYFHMNTAGQASGMDINESVTLTKKSREQPINEDVPAKFRPYTGKYTLALANIEIDIIYREEGLVVNVPNQPPVKLHPPDKQGRWYDQYNKNALVFDVDDSGSVKGATIHIKTYLPKKK